MSETVYETHAIRPAVWIPDSRGGNGPSKHSHTRKMFDINSKVVCIDDSFPSGIHDIYNALPRKGKIYTVRDIVPAHGFDRKETAGVLLHECTNRPNQHGIEPAFQSHRFREPTTDEIKLVEEKENQISS